jgi:elongation factor G
MGTDEDSGKDIAFENYVMGGNIPTNFIPAVEKVLSCCGLRPCC